jgi:hypothetical protein
MMPIEFLQGRPLKPEEPGDLCRVASLFGIRLPEAHRLAVNFAKLPDLLLGGSHA